jgi:hypothetical protein
LDFSTTGQVEKALSPWRWRIPSIKRTAFSCVR